MLSVLIVDDDIATLDRIHTILMGTGYQDIYAGNARTALEMAYRFQPQVAIIPEQLPDMTGSDLCARLKSDPYFENLRVVVVTTGEQVHMPGYWRRVGADGQLAIPYTPADLIRVVRGVLSIVPESV